MDTSLSWIKAYVPDLDVTAQEYTDAMTLTGTKVEGLKRSWMQTLTRSLWVRLRKLRNTRMRTSW